MIKLNIKTVSAKDYQGVSTKTCSISGVKYSDLSSKLNLGTGKSMGWIKTHGCSTPHEWKYDIAKKTMIDLHGEKEYKRLLDLQMKML